MPTIVHRAIDHQAGTLPADVDLAALVMFSLTVRTGWTPHAG
ncbi:MAG TPA: hypothetical protein VMK16_07685 [Acidimicrobiales bacterium]|nr:hypothetical protein [Acidimicrobiales bacterium]